MSTPKVSAICVTYKRHKLLEEAIECFLCQDYPNKELIILSDEPGVTLHCDAPGVKVYNTPDKFVGIGCKRNAACSYATGDLLMPWDDDDIHLPNRMSFSVAAIGDKPYAHFNTIVYCSEVEVSVVKNTIGPNIIFRKDSFDSVGGYRKDNAIGEDFDLSEKLAKLAGSYEVKVPTEEVFYIYRWGLFPHLSHYGSNAAHQQATDNFFSNSPTGKVTLVPQWRNDYTNYLQTKVSRKLFD